MTRRAQTSAGTEEAPNHGGTHNQAEQLTLSYCYECIYYAWKSNGSMGVLIFKSSK